MLIPQEILTRRRDLSSRYLAGEGVELGALHHPLWTSDQAKVRYVDRMQVDDLRKQYPELKDLELVNVDIVDDGETLSSFGDGQLDFIIANHMLEHTENPLGTIRNHLLKIRPGGILYYAVPDKRYSFDKERTITPFPHLIKDDQEGPRGTRLEHFHEWAKYVDKVTDPVTHDAHVSKLLDMNYSIHFHVWDCKAFKSFINESNLYLGNPFKVKYLQQNHSEIIAILEKRSTARVPRVLERIFPFLAKTG